VAISQKQASVQFLDRDPDTEYTEEEQIMAELGQYDSLDDVSYDYQSVDTDDHGSENLLLVNSKRDDVNMTIRVLIQMITEVRICYWSIANGMMLILCWMFIQRPELYLHKWM